jgi:arylsulfatase A-like enzyme
MGSGIAAQVVDRAVRTIDIGPTLAALLGVRPLQEVEGVALAEVVGKRR